MNAYPYFCGTQFFSHQGIPLKDASGKELSKSQQNKFRSEQKKHGEKHRKWLATQQQQSAGLHTSAAEVDSDEVAASGEGDKAPTLPAGRPLGPSYTEWLQAGIRDAPKASPNELNNEN